MQAVILAGGRGLRLKPITEKIPKCLVEVKGKPLLERVFENLIEAGITELNVIVGYKREIIEDHFGAEFGGAAINYFVQQEQLGTAHAVSLVNDFIKDTFLIANADVLASPKDYRRILRVDKGEEFNGLVLARKVEDPWRFGVLKAKGNRIIDVIEKPNPGKEPGNIINAGVYRFEKSFLDSVLRTELSQRGEYEIVDSIRDFIASGKRVDYVLCENVCLDIASMQDLKDANAMEDAVFPK